jgi:nodulation protein E
MAAVITGTGVVSPLAVGTAAFVKAVRDGRSAIKPLAQPSDIAVGARFDGPFDPGIDKKQKFLMDSVSQYAVAAAKEAMAMAGLAAVPANRIGAIIGIGVGAIETLDSAYQELYAGPGRVSPFTIPRSMPSAPASSISMTLGVRGPAFCTASACASSAHAIITGALWLEAGLADAVIVGGSESPFAPGLLRGWNAMRVMADDTCRPFSIQRRGMVLGEGAAMLVLERLDDARARGATILGVLRGYSANADAGHIVQPAGDSVAQAMLQALESAGVSAADVGHVNGHATGTELNDAVEAAAIASVFGARPLVSGTKGATGHALGAAAALEAIICVHALLGQWIPPTLNSLGPDPACAQITISPGAAVDSHYRVAVSSSFAFGGLNAVLVFGA